MNSPIFQSNEVSYNELSSYRHISLRKEQLDHHSLQMLHNQLLSKVLQIAIQSVEKEWGPPPTPFTFFVMGSAGRQEQGVVSDQDHGLLYVEHNAKNEQYFIRLGEELNRGMAATGYVLCEGKIMAGNPKWCLSLHSWQAQVNEWLERQDWASIRHLLIFFDASPVYPTCMEQKLDGNLLQLKRYAIKNVLEHPALFQRFIQNTKPIKKYIGPFRQLYTATHGKYYGCLNIKQAILFPFVHSLRLLALKKKILDVTSTAQRFERLMQNSLLAEILKPFFDTFIQVLKWRALWQVKQYPLSYEDSHYLPIGGLDPKERKFIKKCVQDAYRLTKQTSKILAKD